MKCLKLEKYHLFDGKTHLYSLIRQYPQNSRVVHHREMILEYRFRLDIEILGF